MELIMIENDRATESSDDGDSKQFMILLLAVYTLFEIPRRNSNKRRPR